MEMQLLILSWLLLANVLAIPTAQSPTCQQISYASFEGTICGVIIFNGMSDKTVTVDTSGDGLCGFDSSEHEYHSLIPFSTLLIIVHENSLPSSGDCSAAGDHFDPYWAGDGICNPSQPDTCQVSPL
jgi:hypothetical protein